MSIWHSEINGGAVILPWRLAVAEVFILHNFKKSYKSVGYYCAHFSFDIFRGFSLKGVFLFPFLKIYRFYSDKVYDKISDEEKKSLISSLNKEIEIFPCDEAELPLKSILFNFPVYKDGGDVCGFLWDKSTHVSTWLERVVLIASSM